MNDPERLVALGQRLHDYAETEDVGELLETDRFALHLAPDGIGALAPPRHLGIDAAVQQLSLELLLDFGHQPDVFRPERVKALADDRIGLGIELVERQVLELLP